MKCYLECGFLSPFCCDILNDVAKIKRPSFLNFAKLRTAGGWGGGGGTLNKVLFVEAPSRGPNQRGGGGGRNKACDRETMLS